MRRTYSTLAMGAALFATVSGAMAQAPNCRNTGTFDRWLADFKREAASQGISPAAITAASPYLVLDQRIINIDRGQRFFAQNFLEFSGKLLTANRLQNGSAHIKKHQALFQRVNTDFGVPAAVIAAFWDWKATSVLAKARTTPSDRSQRWPTIAAAPRCSAGIFSTG